MKEYNSAINILGGISDINVIIETIRYFKNNDLKAAKEEFVSGNAFGFDISSSRKRFFSLIKKYFLVDPEKPENKFFMESITNKNTSSHFRSLILYIEFFRKNDLFRDITKELVYNKYKENRRLITTNEIVDFLSDFGRNTKIDDWSEITIKKICSKYNTFMNKLELFEKDKRYKFMITNPAPDEKVITYLIYLLKLSGLTGNEIYQSDLFESLFLDENKRIELMKKGSLAGYYDFNFSGAKNASFELHYSREEIIDELFR